MCGCCNIDYCQCCVIHNYVKYILQNLKNQNLLWRAFKVNHYSNIGLYSQIILSLVSSSSCVSNESSDKGPRLKCRIQTFTNHFCSLHNNWVPFDYMSTLTSYQKKVQWHTFHHDPEPCLTIRERGLVTLANTLQEWSGCLRTNWECSCTNSLQTNHSDDV